VPAEQLEHWRARDPIALQQARLQAQGVDVEATRNAVAEQLDAALTRALEQPMPDPASAAERVFCEAEAEPLGDGRAPYSGYANRGTDHV
jgi:acetoin:2,6-dichlorophenolindophenol oxidoreductase subunit alpha